MTLTLPKRRKDSVKGDNGRVLLVGGSEEYPGAVILAGLAAMRSGCDLAHVVTPSKVAWAINPHTPDLVTRKLPGTVLTDRHATTIAAMLQKTDVLLLGNGIGQAPGTKRLCKRLAKLSIPKVIDADALKALTLDEPRNAILTPNANEWRTLLENSGLPMMDDPKTIQKKLTTFFRNGNALLLKRPRSVIITKSSITVNRTGNAGLTKGGTGDVLAGLCAGYLAQGLDPGTAARNAAEVTGRIGDLLKKKHKGYTYLASDMLSEIRRLRPAR